MRLCLRRQVCLLGGAAQSGPMADAWRLQLAAAPDGCGFAGAWRLAQPLDGGRSWQSASLVSTAEVNSMLVFLVRVRTRSREAATASAAGRLALTTAQCRVWL